MKRLIVNADDFGLTAGVNRAIVELAQARALTSATLMANAHATEEAATTALAHPGLGIGCHIVLVDGSPVLAPTQIPTLMAPQTQTRGFRPILGAFLRDLFRGRIREADIEAEAVAQIRRLQRLGLSITHIDTHKHTHIFPRVLRPLLRAAILCDVACIRNPFEPRWSIAATSHAPYLRRLQVRALATQRKYFLETVEQAGMITTDGSLGILATGTLTPATLSSILAAMPADGTWELVCHPGYNDAALSAAGTRLLKERETERAALSHSLPEALARDTALSLAHFGQLKAAPFLSVM